MIKLLRTFLGLCNHQWEIQSKVEIFDSSTDPLPYAYKYILRCKHCGNMKKVYL